MTKIDFRALDSANVKPVGVYGSKGKIVDLLLEIGAIEPQLFVVFPWKYDLGESLMTP